MNNLSRFAKSVEWIIASPASDSPENDTEFLVSRGAIRKKGKIVRAYVLINYGDRRSAPTNYEVYCEYLSIIYRKDLLDGTSLSRISAIFHFTDSFAQGCVCSAFFYPDAHWHEDFNGFSRPLTQFIKNHTN
jgi:hypothetical protein